MLKTVVCLLAGISYSVTALCVYDLKLVNNYSKDIVVKLVTYNDVRVYKNEIVSENTPEILVFPHPIKQLAPILKGMYVDATYIFAIKPRQALVIEDFLDEEKIAIAGTMFWQEIPLKEAKKLVEIAKLRRLSEHGALRIKEIQSAGGAAYAPPFKPQGPVKDIITVVVSASIFGFSYKFFHKELKEPVDIVSNAR